jgi:hypothetical protein
MELETAKEILTKVFQPGRRGGGDDKEEAGGEEGRWPMFCLMLNL